MGKATYTIGKEILGLLEAQKDYASTVTSTTRQQRLARLYSTNLLLKDHLLIWSSPTGGIQVGLRLIGDSNTDEAPNPVLLPCNLVSNMVKETQLYRSGSRRSASLTVTVEDDRPVVLSGTTKSGETLTAVSFNGEHDKSEGYADLCGMWRKECESSGQSGNDRRLHFNVNVKRMARYFNALVRSGYGEVIMSAPPMYLEDEEVTSPMARTWTITGRVANATPRSPVLAIVASPAHTIRPGS